MQAQPARRRVDVMASKNSYDAKPDLQAILQLLYGFETVSPFYCCIQKVPIKTLAANSTGGTDGSCGTGSTDKWYC